MRYLLGIIGILAFVAALGMCAMTRSATHETTAAICVLIGVVAWGLASLIETVQDAKSEVQQQLRSLNERMGEKRES